MRPTEAGELRFTSLVRKRTHRMKAAGSGLYRWYNDYRLPEHLGGGQITVRLHQDRDDRRRKFNRTENVRPIPPSDPDFPRLYGRRNDSESLNRSLEDTLFLGRAHSLGWRRQQVEMLGWALMVNASPWPGTERSRTSKRPPDRRNPRHDPAGIKAVLTTPRRTGWRHRVLTSSSRYTQMPRWMAWRGFLPGFLPARAR